MRIIAVGASHTTAPLELIERLSIAPGELEAVLAQLRELASESFVLSTCNRTELYAVLGEHGGPDALAEFLERRAGGSPGALRASLVVREGADAARHALSVASGLESMVLGEDQIQAQMKRALAAARVAETLGPALDRLGAAALGCGKRVRAFTGVGQHTVSLESLAVEAAAARAGDLRGTNVVVLGSGSSAGIVVRQLCQRGADVVIVGRTPGSAAALAASSQTTSAPWERLANALLHAAVVICCTSAPHPVLTRETLARRASARGNASLLCIDLGMPHDVEPAAATVSGVSVVTLAELGRIADAHRIRRARHVPAAEAIVERETERFMRWMRERLAARAIASTRARGEALADAELKRALARLQTANAHDRAVIAELARRLARKLMHRTTKAIKLGAPGAGPELSLTEREEAVS